MKKSHMGTPPPGELNLLPSTGNVIKPWRRSVFASLLLLATLTQAGCSGSSAPAAERATSTTTAPKPKIPEHLVKCNPNDPGNRRPLPSPANVGLVKDTRKDGIFACNFLFDEGLDVNKPIPLERVSEETVPVSNFTASGSLGGFAIFGTGVVAGGVRAEGESSEKELTVVTITDMDGRERTIALDQDQVAIKRCATPCEPSLYLGVEPVRLFEKGDSKSIWIDGSGRYRDQIVRSVSESLPEGGRVGAGGPRPLNEVIAALVPPGNVILTVPDSMRVASNGS